MGYIKVKSETKDGKIYFDNFVVVKESNTFYGVYRRFSKYWKSYDENFLITSGTTLHNACKKAKLLQIGYDWALDDNMMY